MKTSALSTVTRFCGLVRPRGMATVLLIADPRTSNPRATSCQRFSSLPLYWMGHVHPASYRPCHRRLHTGHIHWADLGYTARYSPVAAYAQSKLALTVFTKGLAEYGQSGPQAVAVHPGLVKTSVLQMYGRVGAPVGEGAAAVVHLATPGVVLDNGGFYNRLSLARPAPLVQDHKAVGRLWKLSARLTALH